MKDNLKNEILELVKSADIVKPARYLGGEINAIIKPNADFKFIMSFADLYEVAISNLGLSILYEVINSIEYASCERVYAVAYDFEKLLKEKSSKGKLVFVGDGINDAPVLVLADIGIAMGSLGSDAAIEAADVVIMTDEPLKIVNAINLSKKTMKIVRENIIFAIFIKITVLILSAIGIATMREAVFADVGVSIIAIINALRVLKINNK